MMINLNAVMIFVKVAEFQSFSEAARRLGMPVSTVSRKVADLEDQLGVRLLERSTRSLSLTQIGRDVLREAERGVEVSEAIESMVSNQLREVTGLLRLSAPPSIADSLMSPIITAFQAAYPGVRVNVLTTDRFVDHISDGIDLAFRVGTMKDSTLIAQSVLTYRRRLVASPAYLEGCREPAHPEELKEHPLLAFSHHADAHSWTFCNGGTETTLRFVPNLAMNDYAGLASALAAGSGIGDLPPIVRPDLIQSGQLVEIMTGWTLKPETLSLVHVGNRHIARPVRLFREFASRMIRTLFSDLPA